MSTVVVTGANGFIGAPLSALLAAHGHRVRGTVRARGEVKSVPGLDIHVLGALEQQPDWSLVLPGSDCVVHLAGRAHVLHESSANAADAFRRVNVDATTHLFKACMQAGVRRFVFVSSIGVLGVDSGDRPFDASSAPHPTEAYAISKLQAERALTELAKSSETELVIVRPTLVCGVAAKGNFERLVRLVQRGVPLPLASVRGRRNFVGLTNLCELLELCSLRPEAAGRTFLAADEETYTTPQLIRAIAVALSLNARLVPCPPGLLRIAGGLLGRRAEVDRLTGSLLVDASTTRSTLGWRSARPLADELADMARAVRST